MRAGWQLSESRRLETVHGAFDFRMAQDETSGTFAWLLTRGHVGTPEPLLARVHSSCVTSETFGGCDCDCAEQLDSALARIASRGRGAFFYLFQEGRGEGFLAKARDRMLVQASGHRLTTFDAYAQMGLRPDARRYDAVAAIRELAEIQAPLLLLTNNPEKVAALELAAVCIADVELLDHAASPFNHHYVVSKRRSGHRLTQAGAASGAAALPEAVSVFSPRALPGAPHLMQHACYLLPVRVGGRAPDAPLWLRLHAYLDHATGGERVALSIGDPRVAGAAVSVQEQVLLERLSLRQAPTADDWTRTLARFADIGAGVAVFLPPGQSKAVADPATSALLAYHGGASSRL